jgi:hypothetical protein
MHFGPQTPGRSFVTRPAPPLGRRFDSFGPRHHQHGSTFFFVGPYGYPYSPFYAYPYSAFYPYPYSGFYDSVGPMGYAPPAAISTPYYCWIDGIGFTDEQRFVHHLHEAHGVPLESALAASERVGDRYVFFGY